MQTSKGTLPGLRHRLAVVATTVAVALAALAESALTQEAGKFDPSDIWFRAFTLLQDGIKAEESGQTLEALSKYNESKPLFDGLSREFPEFHPTLVEYRRTELGRRIQSLRDGMRKPPGQASQFAGSAVPPPPAAAAAATSVQTGAVTVQPVSPEFAPAESAQQDGSGVPLPQWTQQQPTQSHLPPPAVIRPPAAENSPTVASATENPFQRIQGDFDRMKAEIDRLSKRNQELETDLAYRKSELFDAQKALADSKSRTADLQKQLTEAENRSKADPNLAAEVEKLKKLAQNALDELERAQKEKENLVAQLEKTQADVLRITQERDAIEAERNQLKALMEGNGESAVVAQLMTENKDLRDKLSKVEEAAKSLQKESADKTVEIALLREEANKIRNEQKDLIDKNKRYESHILALRERLKSLGQELSEQDLAQVGKLSAESAQEGLLLRQIVLKQLRRQTQVMKTKELLLRELEKLGAKADHVYAMVEDMASPSELTEEERGFFKTPEMIDLAEAIGDVEDVQAAIVVPAKSSAVVVATGAAGDHVVTQQVADELVQIQKSARLDFQEGRFDEAEKAYLNYLKYQPKSIVCLCNLALVKMATKKHDEAKTYLEKAIAIKNDYGFAYYLLGRTFFQQGKYEDALARLDESIHYDPKNPKAYNCVGVITSQKGFVNRAEAAFNEAVKLDPEFGDAHFNLAVLYATREKPDPNRAAEHYNRAMLLGVPRDNAIENYLDAVKSATTTVSLR
jgi:Flp pilus assembly protein TadD/peptidoglycan hydrolase CwlO-like protein